MNITKINSNLIEEIKKRTSGPVIDLLTEILPMSKESIYRRLRGEVLFSYADAVLISQKLQISLDEINFNQNDYFAFKLYRLSSPIFDESYADLLSSAVSLLKDNVESGLAHFHVVTAGIPLAFIGNYKYLLKFRLYKWIHENRGLEMQKNKLSEVEIPQKISEYLKSLVETHQQIDTTFMLSDGMFINYLKELKHFVTLGLIDKTEIDFIKKDLHALIYELEAVVAAGRYLGGAKVSVYLSDLNIDPTFGYLENGKSEFSFTRIFAMNYAVSQSSELCKMYKGAYEDLKDYAVMISQSGSVMRTIFFNKQHELVEESL